MNKTEAILTQTVEQLERMSEALAALRRELLPGQPKKFAILAEGLLEDMRRLQRELEQLTAEIAAVSPAAA
jgi:septation ring formation regulator EzrA